VPPAELHPSIVARADIRDVPFSLARSGKVAKRSREICRDVTVHDFPDALADVTLLGSPNHVYSFWHSVQRNVLPNRGSRAVVPSVDKGISSVCTPSCLICRCKIVTQLHICYCRQDSAFNFLKMKPQMATNFDGSPEDALSVCTISVPGLGSTRGSTGALLPQPAWHYAASLRT